MRQGSTLQKRMVVAQGGLQAQCFNGLLGLGAPLSFLLPQSICEADPALYLSCIPTHISH